METTEYRLGDICKLRNGYAFKSENFTNDGVPVIRISNINDNQATTDKALKTNPSSVFEKFAVKKGDILIAMSGATTGKFGRYNSEEKAYQNQRVGCFVITDEEKLSNDYLYLLLNGLKRKIETDAYGGGQPNISSTIIENYKINLPSITEQEKIVGVLNRSEKLVKQRRKSIDLLDDLLKVTHSKMFGEPITNKNGFASGTISDVSSGVKYGTSKPAEDEGKYPYLRMNNITYEGYWDFTSMKFINVEPDEKDKYLVKQGDLVFNRTNSKELVGKTAVFDLKDEMILAGYLIRIRLNEKANPWFLWGYLNSTHGKKTLFGLCRNIVGMANINAQEIQSIKILIPPIELQNDFAKIVEKVLEIKTEYQASLIKLEKLLGSLTQRAFRGDLNIVERIEISGSIKIQPKISAEVIAIDNMNKQLADFHNSIANSGAPTEIDNKLKQLDAELKLRGEIPFWDEYVKYRLIKEKQTTSFTFEKLWKEITAFPFESVPDYDTVKKMIFNLLNSDKPFLKQRFNESEKQIELLLNETTSA